MIDAFHRPAFALDGCVVARRVLTMGARTYQPGEELSAADRATLSDREVGAWHTQGLIDTPAKPPADQPTSRPAQQQPRK